MNQLDESRPMETFLNTSIDVLDLSTRCARVLRAENITTVGQLAIKTERRLLTLPDFGPTSLNEIKEKLRRYGLSLGMTFELQELHSCLSDQEAQRLLRELAIVRERAVVLESLLRECLKNGYVSEDVPATWTREARSALGI
jgi:hypothetical protein